MRARRLSACAATLAAVSTMAALAGTPAWGIPLDPCDRFWAGSTNPETLATSNINYPDEFAAYWGSSWTLGLPEGAELVLHAQFPHARYMSFNTYNFNQPPTSLGPNDSLYDVQIEPDPGSTNPYVPGQPRDGANRDYTVTVVSGAAPANPADRAPNTVYTGRESGLGVTLVYRIYLADGGTSVDGDAGLPQAELHLADGSVISGGSDICEALSVERLGGAQGLIDVPTYARLRTKTLVNGVESDVPPPVTHPGVNPPRWERYFNYRYSLVGQFYQTYPGFSTPLVDRSTISAAATGGPLSNKDGYTMVTFGDRGFGQLLVIHGRAPTVPATYNGETTMGSGQVRYWSFCQNEFQSSRYVDCLFDQDIPIARDDTYTIVTGDPMDRPFNAKRACGVAWLDWPTRGDGAPDYVPGGDPRGIPGTLLPPEKGGRREMGMIAYRQLLPDPAFSHGINGVALPGTEAAVLGDYMPTGEYVSKKEFESLACGRCYNPRLGPPGAQTHVQVLTGMSAFTHRALISRSAQRAAGLAEGGSMNQPRRRPVAVIAAACMVAVLAPGGAGAATQPQAPPSGCFWSLPITIDLLNIGFPDTHAIYWYNRFQLPAGAKVRLQADYPHARYMSLNSYFTTPETRASRATPSTTRRSCPTRDRGTPSSPVRNGRRIPARGPSP